MYVIGTAGHVDHGKSTLVKALTGIDPDRLQEEKAREMTIDLGFAWLTLPSGREVSVVDVPGHERFIKNMLAGAGGLDAALLVIAADEGPMPQTEEHLAILHLLGVSRGIAVLTKRDTVDDEWLALVEEEVRERLKGTTLEGAPIVAVSAKTGEGLDELKLEMDRLLEQTEPRADKGRPRLPVDRVFTIAGFGTVVTGTLTDGRFKVGQEVEIVPGGLRSRIRGLQSHKHKVDSIGPGNRVAVNLVGVEVDDLARGMVVMLPGTLEPTTRVDVHLELLADSPVTLEQNSSLDFFTGASETPAQATLLDADRLEPGQSGLVQLRLREPIALAKGDRYIVRRPSPSLTIGGGEVIDPHPRRHKRFSEETLQTLRTLQQGTPEELLLEALGNTAQEVRVVMEKLGLDSAVASEALTKLLESGQVLQLSGQENSVLSPQSSSLIMSAPAWEALMKRVVTLLGHHHHHQPLRRGMSKEELRSRLAREVPAKAFPHVMGLGVSRGVIAEDATTYRLPDFEPTFSPQQKKQVAQFMALHESSPYSPPAPSEVGLDPEVVAALVESGELVKLDEGLLYTRRAYEEMRERILRTIDEQGEVNVAIMRDLFGTTRKYAIPFLEHLDEQKVTRRVGDVRVRW
ncbi:MAG: selenocysteine-specific translation elongation factor [Chloroflexota bacterium]|nr:selenocysteine-specific translation elongation factor [Chloroflexota bacterium]MDQ5866569.1 selenocysteine-specific translation elongation factor [Chloroflexota bacterium]